VAWAESIDYFHRTINSNGNPTVGMAKVFENDVRQDMEEAARLAKVDFSVQIIYNERRQPVEIFAGDIVTAHHAACRVANKFMTTPTAKDADIVVANGYPQNRQAITSLSWARRSLRDGGSAVLIAQHPDALSTIHYLGERWNYKGKPYWEVKEAVESPVSQAAQIIVLAQYMQKRDRVNLPEKGVYVVHSWDQVIEQLKKVHKGDPRVAVYPYGPLQHPELELT
jgi:nickel-dependent lactate racemase